MGTRHWPYDATEAYEKLEQQLAEKNAELDSIKGGEFNRRVQKVADLWKGKCERLEKQNVLLRNALTKLYRVVTQAKPDVTVMCDVHAALDATADLSGYIICDAEREKQILILRDAPHTLNSWQRFPVGDITGEVEE